MIDVVLFPQASLDKSRMDNSASNIITVGSNSNNSAFKQAYENTQKRDYISLVQSSIPAGDSRSEADRFSDSGARM